MEVRARTQGRNLEAGTEAGTMKGCCLPTFSAILLNRDQASLLRDDTTHCELGAST